MVENLKEMINKEVETRWKGFLASHSVEYDWFVNPDSAPSFAVGQGKCSVVDFQERSPFMIVDSITELVSGQAEAKVILDHFFSRVSAFDENIPDGYHSHSQDAGTITRVYTQSAISEVDSPEKIYTLLCNSPYANIPSGDTTERVVSKLYGGQVGTRAHNALASVPTGLKVAPDDIAMSCWRESLQRNVLTILDKSGIEGFESICATTANLLNEGKYEDDKLSEQAMHHHGDVFVDGTATCYKTGALRQATEYLAEQGVKVNVPSFLK
jgi:hypothetical protein